MDITTIYGICKLNTANFLGFDFNVAPLLLYYAYIPISILSVFFSFAFINKDPDKKYSHFPLLTISFLGWIINELIQWVYIYNYGLFIAWQFAAFFNVLLFFSIWLFAFQIYSKNKIKVIHIIFPTLVLVSTSLLIKSQWNIPSYDFENCQGNIGPLWDYIYAFELTTIITTAILVIRGSIKKTISPANTKALISVLLFSLFFYISAFVGDFTGNYSVDLFSSIGMFILLFVFGYLWSQTDIIKTKMIPAQFAFYTSLFLIFSLLLIPSFEIMKLFVAIILIPIAYLGQIAVTSTQREMSQKLELAQANTELEYLNKEKAETLSLATHQLRAPLTGMKWLLPDLVKRDLGSDVNSSIKQLYINAIGMLSTVETFLGSSKIDQGIMKVTLTQNDLVPLCQSRINEYQVHAGVKHITLKSNIPTTPLLINSDEAKLKEVVSVLIDNAIKYTPEGGTVSLSLRTEDGYAIISVSDSGRGLAPGEESKLFQKGIRGSASGDNKGGSGFGLYFAQKIIEMHGGTISAHSAGIDQGTEFEIRLKI